MVAYPWEKLSDLRQAIYPEGFYNVRAPSASHQALGYWGPKSYPKPVVSYLHSCAVTYRLIRELQEQVEQHRC